MNDAKHICVPKESLKTIAIICIKLSILIPRIEDRGIWLWIKK